MKILLLTAILSAMPAFALPTAATFSSYTHEISGPQLFFQNRAALEARLKLLDSAPAGSHAFIATFLFDNGVAVRQLARHVCLASERGVAVEILVDSKSGSRPGVNDTFDKSDDAQVVEELYQYMANCGATISIHNDVESFIEVLGLRLPNIFLDESLNGKKFSVLEALKIKNRALEIVQKTSDLVYRETRAAGIDADTRPLFNNGKNLLLALMNVFSAVHDSPPYNLDPPFNFVDSRADLERYWRYILTDPVWKKVSAAKLREVLPRIEQSFKSDPELGRLWVELRRYNRLNHRKLFLVDSGKDSCAFIGGRNLGDHYLSDDATSFVDGDVLVCKHHSPQLSAMMDQLKAGFLELKTDLSDPILRRASDNLVRTLPANPSYTFRSLTIPSALAPRGQSITTAPYAGKLAPTSRTLLKEISWADAHPAPGGIAIPSSSNWTYLRAGWDPTKDQVQSTFLKLISQERKEVFIETPYAEFDQAFRAQVEAALARGVMVHLITNSFFVTDGGSKLIRITMANWTEKMLAAYPARFAVRYVTRDASHMTHFKGAAFACQPGGQRTFLVGSHNFDPRSGRSDKDHAVTWDEPGRCTDLQDSALVKGRYEVYQKLSDAKKKPALAAYPDVMKELESVGNTFDGKSGDDRWMANALMYMFYVPSGNGYKLNQGETARALLQMLDDSGLHDLVGRIL